MSTYYLETEKEGFDAIETHYFDDGYDVTGLVENGDTYIEEVDTEFVDGLVEIVKDVFSGDNFTYIVTCFEDNGGYIMTAYKMTTDEFKEKWSEKVWAKFRMDSYTHICPICGEKMAHSVAGQTMSDIGRIEQFHCDGCHYTWIGYPSGKFIREGVLHSSWDVR